MSALLPKILLLGLTLAVVQGSAPTLGKIKMVYIKLADIYNPITWGNIWLTIKQGNTECTQRETWYAPNEPGQYFYKRGQICTALFDANKPFKIWVNSDSYNDIFIDRMGLECGGKRHDWHTTNEYGFISKNWNNGWYTTD